MSIIFLIRCGYTPAEIVRRQTDRVIAKIAHHLPRRLAYWSFIDSGVRHIAGHEVVPDVRYADLLKRLGDAGGER